MQKTISVNQFAEPAKVAVGVLERLAREKARFGLKGIGALEGRLIQAFIVKFHGDKKDSLVIVYPGGTPKKPVFRAFKNDSDANLLYEIDPLDIISAKEIAGGSGEFSFGFAPSLKNRVSCLMLISSFESADFLQGRARNFKMGKAMGSERESGVPAFEGTARVLLEDGFTGRKGERKKTVGLNFYVLSFPSVATVL